jgi:hypothetical protein
MCLLLLASCTDNQAGGPGSETTNGIYAKVFLADGTIAANLGVALRKADFIPDSANLTNAMITSDMYTDSMGMLHIDSVPAGNYRLTLFNASEAFSTPLAVSDTANVDLGKIKLSPPGTLQGQISLPEGAPYSWVGMYGLDVLVKTDSLGTFTMPSLPAGKGKIYSLNQEYKEVIADTQVTIISGSTVFWKLTIPSMLLESFDDIASFRDWYYVSDTLATIDSTKPDAVDWLEYDSERQSTVFHGQYSAPISSWVLLGLSVGDSALDFSALDSIVFYAKGNGYMRVSLENWSDLAAEEDNLKAWTGDYPLSSTWTRFVVTPADLLTSTEDPNTTGWESVRENVLQIHIFALIGTEIYLDDIWLYGVQF